MNICPSIQTYSEMNSEILRSAIITNQDSSIFAKESIENATLAKEDAYRISKNNTYTLRQKMLALREAEKALFLAKFILYS